MGRALIAYLDTYVTVWLAQGDLGRISSKAQEIMERADLLVSPMVLIELEYLHEVGRIRLGARDLLRKLSHEIGLRVCELPFLAVADAVLDQKWTRDPFDRTIVAHAKTNGLAALITADEDIRRNYSRAVW